MMSLGKVVRDYVESPDFKADYTAYVDKYFPREYFNPNDEQWAAKKKTDIEETAKYLDAPGVYDMFVQQLDGEIDANQSMVESLSDPAVAAAMGNMKKSDYEEKLKNAKLLKEL